MKGARDRRAHHERAGSVVKPVVRAGQPEAVIIEGHSNLFVWPHLNARAQIADVPPADLIGDAVIGMIGRIELVERDARSSGI